MLGKQKYNNITKEYKESVGSKDASVVSSRSSIQLTQELNMRREMFKDQLRKRGSVKSMSSHLSDGGETVEEMREEGMAVNPFIVPKGNRLMDEIRSDIEPRYIYIYIYI